MLIVYEVKIAFALSKLRQCCNENALALLKLRLCNGSCGKIGCDVSILMVNVVPLELTIATLKTRGLADVAKGCVCSHRLRPKR